MYKTEVQKLLQEMAKLSAEELLRRFQAAPRAEVKLACALQSLQNGEIPEECRRYLLTRIRPATLELVRSENTVSLERLEQQGCITHPLLNELLQAAVTDGAQESIIWLLKRKAQRIGFPDRDFSL